VEGDPATYRRDVVGRVLLETCDKSRGKRRHYGGIGKHWSKGEEQRRYLRGERMSYPIKG
jgi:hypothetical protein